MSFNTDVVIIGAGAAGLAAAETLTRAGMPVALLEARHRLGGRIWTAHDGVVPVELGAEFIHGKAPEILNVLQETGIAFEESQGRAWCAHRGRLQPCAFFGEVQRILEQMKPPAAGDESFRHFLDRTCPEESEARQHALSYVEGFHAADAARISVRSLIRGDRADEEIEADRSFRILSGYDQLVNLLAHRIAAERAHVQLNTLVQSVAWRPGEVRVHAQLALPLAQGETEWTARAAIVTLPLGVLQEGTVRFDPPHGKEAALQKLAMGTAIRVTLQFAERFWEQITANGETLADMSFLFSDDEVLPTWWSLLPRRVPVLTGWAAGPRVSRLRAMSHAEIAAQAVEALARVLGHERRAVAALVERSWTHDWQADPLARGAYSYVTAGGEGAQGMLAEPVQNTLFFAGEAAQPNGHHSTVHGAIASGRHAAEQLLRRLS